MAAFSFAGPLPLPASLAEALTRAGRRLEGWFSDAAGFDALLLGVFGANGERAAGLRQSLSSSPLRLELTLLDGAAMGGALGGYTSAGPNGAEAIVLNRSWLATASAPQIEAVLLEELGHALDHRLNGSNDTAGDEGER
ncbi:MAG: hypothetical protein ACKO50_05385, partial [Cyanobium sp.]